VTARDPRVTVGLPVFNGERHLPRALDSLLAQDFEDFELVISDNASTDATPEICADYAGRDGRLRYYRNEVNLGAVKNFNRTLQLARGDYFKWAAHDDWCAPQFLGRCVAELDGDPSTVLCFTEMAVADHEGKVFRYVRENLAGATSASARERFHSVVWSLSDCTGPVFGLLRTSVLRQIGGLRNAPELDRVLIGELSVVGRIRQIPEPLFFHIGPPGHPRRNQWLWLDPSNAGRIKVATLRITGIHLAAVWRSNLGVLDKASMTGDVIVAFVINRTRSKLGKVRRRRTTSVATAGRDRRTA
jgi:glycosyltransferase involved in cell wall biosynthesis